MISPFWENVSKLKFNWKASNNKTMLFKRGKIIIYSQSQESNNIQSEPGICGEDFKSHGMTNKKSNEHQTQQLCSVNRPHNLDKRFNK